MNGARGVIINVTGGPDLSLMEVSDASTIVQEAADEDANIIFGAVVDPGLKGKIKITVIATGFGPAAAARSVSSGMQTPVDMTPYADLARVRADALAASSIDRLVMPRLAIARRPLLDLPSNVPALPLAASAAGAAPGNPHSDGAVQAGDVNPDFDLTSTFDVPAFLRRQEV